ncbi:NAD(P)H-hydrate dehydratase [Candidatus Woesearchaeota archaeon]|nr:NAD(P)H-hydrate dehydratase [Candidatus Woesearchaeota archaeon]
MPKLITKKLLKIPKRPKPSHKGDGGYVFCIGGSREYTGAIALAGAAALRSGCDLVRIAAPEKVAWAINAFSLDLITLKLKGEHIGLEHAPIILKEAERHDVVLIGNGLGLHPETSKLVNFLIGKIRKPLVLDADALRMVNLGELRNTILTPHHNELENLLQNSGCGKINALKTMEAKVKELSKQKYIGNNVLVVKGAVDYIIAAGKVFANKTGNPGMTKAGTGDVLAGLCAGFLAQDKKRNLLQAAINAAYYNGMIGDQLLKKKKGYSFLASDMVEEIGRLRKQNF